MIKAMNQVKNIDDNKSVMVEQMKKPKTHNQPTKENGIMAIKTNFSNLWLPGS